MNTIYINLFGGPGCGKSVAMAKIFIALKVRGFTCEMVTEYAKDLVWDNCLHKLKNQYEIAERTYERLISRKGKTQYVVTDGPLGNSLYYNRHYPHVCDIDKTEQAVLDWLQSFDSINLFLERGDFPYEQAGRYQSEPQAKAMDAEIYKELCGHIPLIKVPANFTEQEIFELIENSKIQIGSKQ